MGVLTTAVIAEKLQANCHAAGVVTRVQAQRAKPVQRVEIAKAQMLSRDDSPFFVWVIGEKLALIKPCRGLESGLGLCQLAAGEVLMCSFELLLEIFHIKPDIERRLDEVSLVPVKHHGSVADYRA